MRLRLLLGRAGEGRTRRCLEEIRAEQDRRPLGPPLLLIVPDQATFTAEQELVSFLGGSMRARVYGFRRLARYVLRETGSARAVPVDEVGRRMMVKNILISRQQNFPALGRLHKRPGFISSLVDFLARSKMHLLAPEELLAAADKTGLSVRLRQKIKEVALVYRFLEEKMTGSLTDPEGLLLLLAENLPRADFLKGCRVWVDGFSTFTPLELAVLQNLLPLAEEVTVTLCLPPLQLESDKEEANEGGIEIPDPEEGPFLRPASAFRNLLRLAERAGAECTAENLPEPAAGRFREAPELAYLEENLFCYTAPPYREPANRIQVMEAVNPRAEAEGIGREVRRLLRQGLLPRQIMVAARLLDVYFPLLHRVFSDYGIPFFIDHRQPASHHPLVELLRSALEVIKTGWDSEPVLRYLKTGFTAVPREKIDLLENYVLAAGIRGGRWFAPEPWRYRPEKLWARERESGSESENGNENGTSGFHPSDGETYFDLDEIDLLRKKAINGLNRLREEAGCAPGTRLSGRRWAELLAELALDLDVPAQLSALQAAATAAGNPEEARQHSQAWQAVTGVLDQLAAALADTPLSAGDLSSVLEAAWEELSYALIPPRAEAVVVGTLERSRPPRDLQVLFLAGLNDGVLPAAVHPAELFTESEREELAAALAKEHAADFLFADRQRWEQEQFNVYVALTRTGGRLYLSWPLGDSEGKALLPSPVVQRVKELFPGAGTRLIQNEPLGGEGDLEWLEHPAGLLPHLARRFREATDGREVNPAWWRLYNLLLADAGWREKLSRVAEGLRQRNQEPPLGEELGFALWSRPQKEKGGRVLAAGISRLESFARCPFSFFLEYGLKLRPRPVYQFTPPAAGHLYHEALQRFVEEIKARGASWEQLSDREINVICGAIVEDLARELQGSILLSSGRLRRQKEHLAERVEHTARAVARHFAGCAFRPWDTEVPFGTAAAGRPVLPALEIPLGEAAGRPVTLALSGRIDRLDTAAAEGSLFIRVVDYKTTPADLRLDEVLSGLNLQLLFYLLAAEEGLPAVLAPPAPGCPPAVFLAGAFSFPVQRPLLPEKITDPREQFREWLKTFRLRGLLFDHGHKVEKYFRLLDSTLTPGTSSLLVPLALNKSGCVSGKFTGRVLSPAEWAFLRETLKEVAVRIGRDMLAGRVDIAPARTGPSLSCTFCLYRPVCRFDPALPENRPRGQKANPGELRRLLSAGTTKETKGGPKSLVLYRLDS